VSIDDVIAPICCIGVNVLATFFNYFGPKEVTRMGIGGKCEDQNMRCYGHLLRADAYDLEDDRMYIRTFKRLFTKKFDTRRL